MSPNTLTGTIVFYLAEKGYGYVRVPDTREEFRFRSTNLLAPVQAGDWVSFVLKQHKKDYFADEIRPVGIA
ncbi:MAG: hypothetical protein AAFN81_21980 [Bacteroidota bacterium]